MQFTTAKQQISHTTNNKNLTLLFFKEITLYTSLLTFGTNAKSKWTKRVDLSTNFVYQSVGNVLKANKQTRDKNNENLTEMQLTLYCHHSQMNEKKTNIYHDDR